MDKSDGEDEVVALKLAEDELMENELNDDKIASDFVSVIEEAAGYDSSLYQPVIWHWFVKCGQDKKHPWKPFSFLDSVALEEAYQAWQEGRISADEAVVSTDGGRYDVHVPSRSRKPVYWTEAISVVRRCSWFYKGSLESRYTPYEEDMADKLEEEYRNAVINNQWRRILEFPHGEKITFQSSNVMLHFPNLQNLNDWNQVTDGQMNPLIVKRGIDGMEISDGEPTTIDHLVFLVHGIGSVCDFRFRNVVEVVDDFRSLANKLLQVHFSKSVLENKVGRVELLPVSWHRSLHGDDTGIDRRLKNITLPSIPKLRFFANDTILDVLFYTSPIYCETIISTVGLEINRLYDTFVKRNPTFKGEVTLAGHSLGSVILFDLLVHQHKPKTENEEIVRNSEDTIKEDAVLDDPSLEEICHSLEINNYLVRFKEEELTFSDLLLCSDEDLAALGLPLGPRKRLMTYLRDVETRRAMLKEQSGDIEPHTSTVSYTVGAGGTGQPNISYPILRFQPAAFYALGSPIAIFVTVRGIDRLGSDFTFPTCRRFYNIFHPYDPVAYRLETLFDENMINVPPVMIPHHKGRKRMHLELKETVARVSADLKQKFLGSFRSTWNTVQNFTTFGSSENVNENEIIESEKEIEESFGDLKVEEVQFAGKVNGGTRIDYVLQEAPLESFNEYLFAVTSHLGYWESEDTMLLLLRETYAGMGVYPDGQIKPT